MSKFDLICKYDGIVTDTVLSYGKSNGGLDIDVLRLIKYDTNKYLTMLRALNDYDFISNETYDEVREYVIAKHKAWKEMF